MCVCVWCGRVRAAGGENIDLIGLGAERCTGKSVVCFKVGMYLLMGGEKKERETTFEVGNAVAFFFAEA